MLSLAGWVFALSAAVCATVLAAAAHQPMLHAAATGLVGLVIAILAIRDHQRLRESRAPTTAIASSTARYLGLTWAWGALALLITYTIVIERRWPEWWQFCLGFAFAAVVSLAFANLLDRDRAAGRADTALVMAGRVLLQVQLVGMAAGLISLFLDGKFPRGINYADWAGCNIFFCGALTIALISLDALRAPAHV